MDTVYLEKIGLTKNQSTIYLSLVKIGMSTAHHIMKDTGLHSSRIYEGLEKLQQLGLVSFVVKDYKRYFQAAGPEKLLQYLDEKKQIVMRLLPELKKLESTKKEDFNAFIYKGKDGLKTIHSQMLKEGKDVYLIGAKGIIFSQLPYFMPNFEKERIKKKIKFHLIYDNMKVKKYEEQVIKRKYFSGKSFPLGFVSNTVVNIFGNKIAIVLWKQGYPIGFMIENRDVADSFRKWFDFIYAKI